MVDVSAQILSREVHRKANDETEEEKNVQTKRREQSRLLVWGVEGFRKGVGLGGEGSVEEGREGAEAKVEKRSFSGAAPWKI